MKSNAIDRSATPLEIYVQPIDRDDGVEFRAAHCDMRTCQIGAVLAIPNESRQAKAVRHAAAPLKKFQQHSHPPNLLSRVGAFAK